MAQLAHSSNNQPEVLKQTNNFDFIEYSYPALYQLSQQAEHYYSIDQACCLLKIRLFVELWCHEVASELGVNFPANCDLYTKISCVSRQGKIPDYIAEVLNQLRVEANRQVHVVQDMYGQWKSDSLLPGLKMKQIMKGVHELAFFIEYSMKGKSYEHFVDWKEPNRSQMADYIYEAMSGNAEATFKVAKHYSMLIEQIKGQANTREEIYRLQRDLNYWLRKAKDQQHPEVWLLYATSYARKQLLLPENTSVNDYFKKAIEHDRDGEAEYQFGLYLQRNNEQKKAISHVENAAAKKHFLAIRKLQEHYFYKDKTKFEFYVDTGVEVKEPRSFLLQALIELEKWLQQQDDELQEKKARSALLCALHRNVAGSQFLLGYCYVFGYLGYQQDRSKGLKVMADHHDSVSDYHQCTKLAFDAFKLEAKYRMKAIKVAPYALMYPGEENNQAMRFDLAMLILAEMRSGTVVNTPYDLRELIRDAAREEYEPAAEFMNSREGKALLADTSIKSRRRPRKLVDRAKQKKAKRLAKKTKRNK